MRGEKRKLFEREREIVGERVNFRSKRGREREEREKGKESMSEKKKVIFYRFLSFRSSNSCPRNLKDGPNSSQHQQ